MDWSRCVGSQQRLAGHGLDLVESSGSACLPATPGLEERLFTPAEIAYCRAGGEPELHFAARFAAKEAVGKLLGSGVCRWREIEVAGVPARRRRTLQVVLSGQTAQSRGDGE